MSYGSRSRAEGRRMMNASKPFFVVYFDGCHCDYMKMQVRFDTLADAEIACERHQRVHFVNSQYVIVDARTMTGVPFPKVQSK